MIFCKIQIQWHFTTIKLKAAEFTMTISVTYLSVKSHSRMDDGLKFDGS